jgi:ATP-dependent exoDNAse (exonuclease V) beta subunit
MDEKYEKINNYLFTNSVYKKEIEDREIYKHNERIYFDEIINTQYVAMTRPKANLILCIEPTKTTKNKEEVYILKNDLLISPIEKFFNITRENLLSGGTQMVGSYIKYSKDEGEEGANFSLDKDIYIKAVEKKNEKINEESIEEVEIKDEFPSVEKELKRKIGLAIHYYLENIEYASKEEKEIAKKMMINKYSNMLGTKRIEEILDRVEEFISNNSEVFNERWSVFRELEILNDGKKKIIDRLNIDERKKEIIIYDYKSGITMKQSQLDEYEEIIRGKVGEEYKIETKFLKLD